MGTTALALTFAMLGVFRVEATTVIRTYGLGRVYKHVPIKKGEELPLIIVWLLWKE